MGAIAKSREKEKGEIELDRNLITFVQQAAGLAVTDQKSLEVASDAVHNIDTFIKRIKAYWQKPKKAAHEAHQSITQKEREMLNPMEEARLIVTDKTSVYLTEQEDIRQKEQDELDQVREKEEAEKRKRLEVRAVRAEGSGKEAKAEELREQADAVSVPVEVVEPSVAKTTRTDGGAMTQKKDVVVTVTDDMEVLRQIVAGVIPIGVVSFSNAKLKAWVKLYEMKKCGGLRIEEKMNVSFRGKK